MFGEPEEGAQNWHESFRTWRRKRLAEVEREYGDRLDEVAAFLKEFTSKVEALGPRGYLESMSHRAGEPTRASEERERLESLSLDELRDELPKPEVAMRGSVVKKGDRYYVKIELDPDPLTGRRRQKWHSGYRTKREAEKARVDLLSKFDRGEYVEPTQQTLAEYLTEWLAAIEHTVRV